MPSYVLTQCRKGCTWILYEFYQVNTSSLGLCMWENILAKNT